MSTNNLTSNQHVETAETGRLTKAWNESCTLSQLAMPDRYYTQAILSS